MLADEGFEKEVEDVYAAFSAIEYQDNDSDEEEGSGSDEDGDAGSDGGERRRRSRGGSDSGSRGASRSRSGSGSRRSRSASRSERSERSRSRSKDGNDSDNDENDNPTSSSKRRRSASPSREPKRPRALSPRSARREQRRKLKDHRGTVARYYASGTSYSKSAAGLAYLLCQKLGRERIEALWMAIVSLAHQYAHGLIPLRHYIHEIRDLYKPEVLKFSSGLLGAAAADENSQPDSQQPTSSSGDGKASGIYFVEDEFQFALFRHWNLFDSMQHSEYVCTKLGLWKDKGRKKMQSMLAEMG